MAWRDRYLQCLHGMDHGTPCHVRYVSMASTPFCFKSPCHVRPRPNGVLHAMYGVLTCHGRLQYMAWRAAIPRYSMAWTTPVNPRYMPWRASVHGMDVKVLQLPLHAMYRERPWHGEPFASLIMHCQWHCQWHSAATVTSSAAATGRTGTGTGSSAGGSPRAPGPRPGPQAHCQPEWQLELQVEVEPRTVNSSLSLPVGLLRSNGGSSLSGGNQLKNTIQD